MMVPGVCTEVSELGLLSLSDVGVCIIEVLPLLTSLFLCLTAELVNAVASVSRTRIDGVAG
jgi:hypothetical protein